MAVAWHHSRGITPVERTDPEARVWLRRAPGAPRSHARPVPGHGRGLRPGSRHVTSRWRGQNTLPATGRHPRGRSRSRTSRQPRRMHRATRMQATTGREIVASGRCRRHADQTGERRARHSGRRRRLAGRPVIGIAGYFEDRRFLANFRPTPVAWWYKHMDGMVGSGIAFSHCVSGLRRAASLRRRPHAGHVVVRFVDSAARRRDARAARLDALLQAKVRRAAGAECSRIDRTCG